MQAKRKLSASRKSLIVAITVTFQRSLSQERACTCRHVSEVAVAERR